MPKSLTNKKNGSQLFLVHTTIGNYNTDTDAQRFIRHTKTVPDPPTNSDMSISIILEKLRN